MRILKKQKQPLIFFINFVIVFTAYGQTDSVPKKVYHVKLKYELPVAVACIGLSNLGFRNLDKVSVMNVADIIKLNPEHINSFDRSLAFIDPAGFKDAQKKSELFLNISLFTPALLALDKRIRKDWLDLITLYLVTHAVDNALYFAGTYSARRPRPLTYNPKLTMEEKTGEGKSNSFFSGHVSFAAAAAFFARVYTDYRRITSREIAVVYSSHHSTITGGDITGHRQVNISEQM